MPEFLPVCEKAARAAAAVLMENFGKVTPREKGPADLVTEADLAAQRACRRTILESFPNHVVIGEEDDEASGRGRSARSDYRWVVDPLDGTTNYVHRVPHFCVSLALEHRGELLVGTVFNPVSGECFTAAAGEGAYLNGQRIHTSGVTCLSQALAGTGFPAVVRDDSQDLILFLRAIKLCQSVRRTGSAGLNLAYLAAGRFDVAWCYSTKVWDVAAGVLLIREAGGIVSGPTGGPFVLEEARLLAAATEPLHRELAELATSVFA
jgi:myo-inositol-1(or 4)-monophosphatase